MRILLTGPTGFIGAAFAKLASSHGHEVAGLVIPSETIPPHLAEYSKLRWIRGTLDEAPWREIGVFQPEVCVHTAWVTAPGVYLESPDNIKFLESSVKFLRKVRELGAEHLVGLGTCVEYRISDKKLSEELTPAEPTTTYARCKDELRKTLEADAEKLGFVPCWARVFYPYGPREHPSRLCSSLIQKLRQGEKSVLKTPGSTKDYIYIDDLAAALLRVVEKRFRGIINVGTGTGTTVREIAQTLGTLLGRPELIEEINPPQIDPFGYVVSDNARLQSLGWRQEHTMKQGLEKLISATLP